MLTGPNFQLRPVAPESLTRADACLSGPPRKAPKPSLSDLAPAESGTNAETVITHRTTAGASTREEDEMDRGAFMIRDMSMSNYT